MEFDLHKFDDITKLYVPSRGNSRAGSRQSSRGGSRAGGSRGGESRGEGSRGGGSRGTTAASRVTTPGTPFFEPIDFEVQEGQRPKTSDRPVVWSEAAGQYMLAGGKEGGEKKEPRKSIFSKEVADMHVSSVSRGSSRSGSRGGDTFDAASRSGSRGGNTFDALASKPLHDSKKVVDMKEFAAGFAGVDIGGIVKKDLGELSSR